MRGETAMYFVIRCNYISKLTNKQVVGFFSKLSDAQELINNLPNDQNRNLVVITRYDTGLAYYMRPTVAYRWSDYYQIYVPVMKDDVVNKLLVIY
jgi:hypothetical protein